MSTRLVILGLLKNQPLHGYELKHIIESHMGDWTNIAFGSIYFALKKLTEEKLVQEIATEQKGNRPSRRVYQITSKGKVEFEKKLLQLWESPERTYFNLDIGLFFIRYLSDEKRIPLIQERIAQVRSGLEHLEKHAKEIQKNPYVPKEAGAIFSHSYYHQKAELEWLKDVEAAMKRGEY